MILLAVETATEACSAALWQDGRILERFEVAPRRHTELVLPMIDSLLAEAGLSLRNMDALAFGHGPGSFTGVRIATGVIQGLALAVDRPVIGISSLASLAQSCAAGRQRVIAALDARMHEVYWGCYHCGDDGIMMLHARELVCPPAEVPVPEAGHWLAAGSGWASYGDILQQRLSGLTLSIDTSAWPRAAATARLAAVQFAAGHYVSAAEARPVYLRDRVVQVPGQNQ